MLTKINWEAVGAVVALAVMMIIAGFAAGFAAPIFVFAAALIGAFYATS